MYQITETGWSQQLPVLAVEDSPRMDKSLEDVIPARQENKTDDAVVATQHAFDWGDWHAGCAFDNQRTSPSGRRPRLGLLSLIICMAVWLQLPAFATQQVSLTWNASSDPLVMGYNVYYGTNSGNYTAVISAGTNAAATVTGLVAGVTYYFAAQAFDRLGLESPFSSEIAYTAPTNAILSLQPVQANGTVNSLTITAAGAVPNTWTLQSSTNLKTWTTIAQGTNSTVSLSVPVGSLPMQFFRLVGP